MPNSSVNTALSLFKNDPSKILDLLIAGDKITPGQEISKAGEWVFLTTMSKLTSVL
jgi:hypothetical protein